MTNYLLAIASVCCIQTVAVGQWVQWPVNTGGNGHYYRITDAVSSWNEAEAEALTHGGHLVSIGSASEDQWIFNTFAQGENIWIGLFQDLEDSGYTEPDGAWQWSDGTEISFANWVSFEPNNDHQNEHWAEMKGSLSSWPGQWNDLSEQAVQLRGVIEVRSIPTCPGDVTGDGDVDIVDLNAVIGNFGTAGPEGDADNNGTVDIDDLNLVLGNFGTTCP